MAVVTVVFGAGSIGHVIAQRVSACNHELLAELRQDTADAAAKVLSDAGVEVTTIASQSDWYGEHFQ